MCLNSERMFDTETVRVRPVNCYGPYEHYTPFRGFIPKFIYHSLMGKPYTVFLGHKRIIDYVTDTCRTLGNIIDNFISGEVYNIGGRNEWEHDIKSYSDIVLDIIGIDDSLVNYQESEDHTTQVKTIDCSKAIKDLGHDPVVTPREGIKNTVDWMKKYYNK